MKKYIYGIDIGGTTVKIGLFDMECSLLQNWEIPTNKANNGMQVLHDIVSHIKQTTPDLTEVLGYGFGVPGPVVKDYINICVNLGWKNIDLVAELAPILHNTNIRVGNDANVAALGEAVLGAGHGRKNVAMITLGTGVGSGIVVDGELLEGHNGSAGEIGHLTVAHDDPLLCNCGKRGCLETVASATGIVNLYHKEQNVYTGQSILRTYDTVTSKDIFDAAKADDDLANIVVDKAADYIAYACHVVSVTTNPSVIIIGGGVSKAGAFLIDRIKHQYTKYSFIPDVETEIITATLGNDAGMFGAAGLVKNNG